MPASIGVNLRVTGHCRQGGRKYMEDFFSVAYQQTEDEKDLEYAFFGIYDGHGGAEAAAFAKEHLMETIIKHKNFWSENDQDVLHAIKDGYIATHYAMWREQAKWPRTASGLPSTAGTTASVAFIRRGKMYIGHVGDSGIILGYQEPGSSEWKAKPLTKDHKPENPEEIKRIESCGGKVVAKAGVPRVVWNRPKIGHLGPVRRSTPIDEIPFLAVARSLGDLWSYNSQLNQFVVSPDPDCSVIQIDTNVHRCLIFGTDGLYNMLSSQMAVHIVQQAERHNECAALSDATFKTWLNPSKLLVEKALDRWEATRMRADNTTVVTLMLDPPGPPRAQVLKDRKKNLPESGLKIVTRYEGNTSPQQQSPETNCEKQSNALQNISNTTETTKLHEDSTKDQNSLESVPTTQFGNVAACCSKNNNNVAGSSANSYYSEKITENEPNALGNGKNDLNISSSDYALKERNFLPKPRESMSFDPRVPEKSVADNKKGTCKSIEDNTIQINEISSSNIEEDVSLEAVTNVNKASLRSATKLVKPQENEAKRGVKRKLVEAEPVQPSCSSSIRKSSRISQNIQHNNKKDVQIGGKALKKLAPCTLAEEKLKKLAEEAEKIKLKHVGTTVKSLRLRPAVIKKKKTLSLAQKILKSKKLNLMNLQRKKKQKINTATILKQKKNRKQMVMSKKKIQIVLDTITKKSSGLMLSNKRKLLKAQKQEALKQKKIVNKSSQLMELTVNLNNNNVMTRQGTRNELAVDNKKEECSERSVHNIENVAKNANKNKKEESNKSCCAVGQQIKKKNEVRKEASEVSSFCSTRSSSRLPPSLSNANVVVTKEEKSTKDGVKNSSSSKKQRAFTSNSRSVRIQEKLAKK